MLDFLERTFLRDVKKSHIAALDISTGGITALYAIKHETAAWRRSSQGYEILKIFKLPIDLIGAEVDKSSRASKILNDAILKIMKDIHAFNQHLDLAIINFSDPFFSEIKLEKIFRRKNPHEKIVFREADLILRSLGKDAVGISGLAPIGQTVLGYKINGYVVAEPEGYRGKSLEVSAAFTFINTALKEAVESSKDKFFPKAKIRYMSDSGIVRILLKQNADFSSGLIFALDGESTAVYWVAEENINHIALVSFGTKTVERRVAARLKVKNEEAESLISRFSEGVLENDFRQKVSVFLSEAIKELLENILAEFKKKQVLNSIPKKIAITGRAKSLVLFADFLKKEWKGVFGFEAEVGNIGIDTKRANEIFHPPSFIAHENGILMASLLGA